MRRWSRAKISRACLTTVLGAVLLLCLPALSSGQAAQERINSFSSVITVRSDGTIAVVEAIAVTARQEEIKHGIYRDFPTVYTSRNGTRSTVAFDVESVTRDGNPDPYRIGIAPSGNGKRVYIGDPNALVPEGHHTYTIVYVTTRQLGFFKDHDELYWNVTGNGWIFPIERVWARVVLPTGVQASSIGMDGWTGPRGSKAKDLSARLDEQGSPVYVTTAPLGPHEGLTILATWPKGFVAEPTRSMRVRWFITDNAVTLISLVGLMLVTLYYLIAQKLVGIDPPKGAVVPQWEPPDGLSPAALRYISKMGYDDSTLSCALINAAIKGCIVIDRPKRTYSIKRGSGDTSALAPEEEVAVRSLTGGAGHLKLNSANLGRMQDTIKSFRKSLSTQLRNSFFDTHRAIAVIGTVLSAATLIGAIAADPRGEGAVLIFFVLIWLCVSAVTMSQAGRAVKARMRNFSATGIGCGVVFLLVWTAAFFAIASKSRSRYVFFVAVALPAVNFIFYRLLKAYTPKGRAIMDRICGLRLYLSAAEQHRFDALNPPDRSLQLFEKLLPYALALGVEQQWSDQFAEELSAARQGGYQPSWYTGRSLLAGGTSGFASAFGSSFAGAVSSASSSPGSSSGSGGGGSSGGGGGGGGGGGW